MQLVALFQTLLYDFPGWWLKKNKKGVEHNVWNHHHVFLHQIGMLCTTTWYRRYCLDTSWNFVRAKPWMSTWIWKHTLVCARLRQRNLQQDQWKITFLSYFNQISEEWFGRVFLAVKHSRIDFARGQIHNLWQLHLNFFPRSHPILNWA